MISLKTILAGITAALPHLANDATAVANVANSVKTAAVDAGQWTEDHEGELAVVTAAASTPPAAAVATAPAPTPETA